MLKIELQTLLRLLLPSSLFPNAFPQTLMEAGSRPAVPQSGALLLRVFRAP